MGANALICARQITHAMRKSFIVDILRCRGRFNRHYLLYVHMYSMYGTYDSVFDFHVVFRELRERFLQYIFNLSILRGLLIIEKKAKIKKTASKS